MYSQWRDATDEQKKKWFLALVGILFSLLMAIVLNRVPDVRYKSDIFLRWYAATQLLNKDRNLYDPQNSAEAMKIVYGDAPPPRTTNFYYPAHLFIFLLPLALMPYLVAHLIWTAAVQLFYLVAIWLMIRLARWPQSVNHITLFLILCTLFVPQLQHTIWSQFNTIGLLSMVLSYQSLRTGHYAQAGLWAVGLTFKPQTYLLMLAFLLLWAFFDKTRWRFYAGFSLASVVCWGIAEIFQPRWVFDFLASLGGYIPTESALTQYLRVPTLVGYGLALFTFVFFLKHRREAPETSAFITCLILSVSVWFLVIPIVGMFHIVTLPVMVVLLLSRLKNISTRWYLLATSSFLILYLLGWVGFIGGLSTSYGQHILWSEFAYKMLGPLLTIGFAFVLYYYREVTV